MQNLTNSFFVSVFSLFTRMMTYKERYVL